MSTSTATIGADIDLATLSHDSTDARLLAIGEWLMGKFGMNYPRAVETWRWFSSMTEDGRNGGQPITASQTLPNDPIYRAATLAMDVKSQAFHDKVLQDVPCHVAGQYTLSINGVVCEFVRGESSSSTFDAQLNRRVTNVQPKVQEFTGRVRDIDPRSNTGKMEWLFFWLHPMNFHGPCRRTEAEQNAVGVTIFPVDHKYADDGYFKPRICRDGSADARAKKVMEQADKVDMLAIVRKMENPDLRKISIATGMTDIKPSEQVPLREQYLSHLYEVVYASSGSPEALSNLAKLKAMTARGYEHVIKAIQEAVQWAVLEMEDSQLYLVAPGGARTQPEELLQYLVPVHAHESWEDWVASRCSASNHDALVALLEMATAGAQKAQLGDRTITHDITAAVDRAYRLGTIQLDSKAKAWTLADGEVLKCPGRFGDKDAQHKHLLHYMASMSPAAALAKLGVADLGEDE
jgi:hypothetical protein